MILSSNNMCIHASGFGCTIKACICAKGSEIRTCTSKPTHSKRSSETHTSEIFQDFRSRREEISRSPQHTTLSKERHQPWQ
jgi:hypothetical protein